MKLYESSKTYSRANAARPCDRKKSQSYKECKFTFNDGMLQIAFEWRSETASTNLTALSKVMTDLFYPLWFFINNSTVSLLW